MFDLFISLFIAFVLMSFLKPSVNWLVKKKVPRSLAAVSLILLSLSFIVILFYIILPPLINQSVDFISYLSKQFVLTMQELDNQFSPVDFIQIPTLTQHIPNLTNAAYKTIFSVFGNFLNFVSIFFFTLYFLLGINKLDSIVNRFFEKEQAKFVLEAIRNVEKQLGLWVRAMVILMFTIGVMSYIGLTLLGVNYALPLAVMAGLLEVLPIIGPIVAAIPAFFVAATSSWVLGVAVIALYIIIQQLENNLMVPGVMKKAIGIPPLAVLIVIIVGQKIAGVIGILLAVPFLAAAVIIYEEIIKYRETQSIHKNKDN